VLNILLLYENREQKIKMRYNSTGFQNFRMAQILNFVSSVWEYFEENFSNKRYFRAQILSKP